MADTVPASSVAAYVTRPDTNLNDPKFNETFSLAIAETELSSKAIRVDICWQLAHSSSEPQSLVSLE